MGLSWDKPLTGGFCSIHAMNPAEDDTEGQHDAVVVHGHLAT